MINVVLHRMFIVCLVAAIGTVASLAACAQPAPAFLTPVTVQLQWTHQAEFAGFYAADQKGYYHDEGLAVTFIQGGPAVDNLAAVVNGQAQFGTATAEQLIVARANSQPVRAIATIYRHSPTVFFALANSGITRPQDFAGKTIRVPSTIISTLHAMTTRVGVTPDQYTEVNLPSDVTVFASGQVPVWGAYVNALPLLAQRAGLKINLIYPDDYGVHFYGDCVFTTDGLMRAQPDLVTRFVRATLKGWTYAVENPAQVGPMVVNYQPDADAAIENAKMTVSLALVNTGEDHIGWMKPQVWADMTTTLRQQGVLTQSVEVTQAYSLQFLETIYP